MTKYQLGDRVVITPSDRYPYEMSGAVVRVDDDPDGEWYDIDCGTSIRRALTPMQLHREDQTMIRKNVTESFSSFCYCPDPDLGDGYTCRTCGQEWELASLSKLTTT